MQFIALGNVVDFEAALLVLKYAMKLVVKYGFRFFGYYRIVVGIAILVLLQMGVALHLVK